MMPANSRTLIVCALLAVLSAPAFAAATATPVKRAAARTVRDLVDSFSRRVVAIDVERTEDHVAPRLDRRRLRGLSEDDRRDLEDYYRRPDGPVTGLLLDSHGHVLTTNYNLGRSVKDVRVRLASGESLEAEVLGRDPTDDLALVKIRDAVPESYELPPLEWAGDDAFTAGGFVIALGRSPDPSRVTATLGIVSAPTRNNGRIFQTDAALNYGNVGGPLIDLRGRVLGVAAFVGHSFPQWGFNSGIGFGIRADRVQHVLPILVSGKNVPRPVIPYLGVGPAGNGDDPRGEGARIGLVQEGSAAADGGVRRNDVIVEWDGERVEDFMQLRRLIFRKAPGKEIAVKVDRSGSTVELKITLGRFTETEE